MNIKMFLPRVEIYMSPIKYHPQYSIVLDLSKDILTILISTHFEIEPASN